ncbi:RING-type E3 ubiquitin-protein ligase PPIL2 [Taenia solium]
MGKKQHQSDKLYITNTEWSTLYGGKKAAGGGNVRFRRLPFNCCRNIFPFVKKYGVNPVTGKKMKASELIKLNFCKNADGKYHCPITFKVFNQNTHIVAIRNTGNVYAYAVERLNIKTNSYQDLLTSEPFTRKDIITIQDPGSLEKFNISAFYHVKNSLLEKVGGGVSNIRALNPETKEILTELENFEIDVPDYMYSSKPKEPQAEKVRDTYNTAHYSTGKAAASLTSTVMEPFVVVEPAILEDDVVRYRYVKSKGFVRLTTSHGNLNIELHCNLVPKTCENFIKLCESGAYNDTIFHRVIRHFIIQGGDPSGTGLGGDSAWGGSFPDEFRDNLKHDARGVLSMANSGPNTNKSQFFITFRPCPQLNRKHTVFGKVVGGLDTLDKVELVETDKDDRPLEEIKLLSTQVFVNPFKEVDEMLARERQALREKEADEANDQEAPKPGNRREEEAIEAVKRAKKRGLFDTMYQQRTGVGKFVVLSPDDSQPDSNPEPSRKKQKTVLRSTLSDFSAW